MTNIIVAFPKIEDAKSIRNILVRGGLKVTSVCNCGAQALAAADDLNDGIIISGYRFSDMQYDELYRNMPRYFEMLLITTKVHQQEASSMGVPCITMPLKAADLVEQVGNMDYAITRKRRKRKEKPVERSDADRRFLIDAKHRLMERKGWSEDEAHRYIQKCSMDTGTSMVETAKKILSIM